MKNNQINPASQRKVENFLNSNSKSNTGILKNKSVLSTIKSTISSLAKTLFSPIQHLGKMLFERKVEQQVGKKYKAPRAKINPAKAETLTPELKKQNIKKLTLKKGLLEVEIKNHKQEKPKKPDNIAQKSFQHLKRKWNYKHSHLELQKAKLELEILRNEDKDTTKKEAAIKGDVMKHIKAYGQWAQKISKTPNNLYNAKAGHSLKTYSDEVGISIRDTAKLAHIAEKDIEYFTTNPNTIKAEIKELETLKTTKKYKADIEQRNQLEASIKDLENSNNILGNNIQKIEENKIKYNQDAKDELLLGFNKQIKINRNKINDLGTKLERFINPEKINNAIAVKLEQLKALEPTQA